MKNEDVSVLLFLSGGIILLVGLMIKFSEHIPIILMILGVILLTLSYWMFDPKKP